MKELKITVDYLIKEGFKLKYECEYDSMIVGHNQQFKDLCKEFNFCEFEDIEIWTIENINVLLKDSIPDNFDMVVLKKLIKGKSEIKICRN